jgi:hypothetical protein
MSIWCEIWMPDSDIVSSSAEFGVLPRVGERVQITLPDGASRRAVVKDVVHIALDLQAKDSRASVQLWIADA